MRLWRLCKAKHQSTAFTGIGARNDGGRWNSPGITVVYTSESRALAILEARVNSLVLVPDLVLIPADLPDDVRVVRKTVVDMPANWKEYPHPQALRDIGDQWVAAAETVALVVPSVVAPGDMNVILNPSHPDFSLLEIGSAETFEYDDRLYSR